MSAQIHVCRNGKQLGSFQQDQIQDMVNAGILTGDDLYWTEGNEDWQPLRNIVSRTLPPPAPNVGNATSFNSNAKISGEHPGFWLRFAAHLIDSVILFIGFSMIHFIMGIFYGDAIMYDDVVDSLTKIFAFIAVWVYYALMESSHLQATVGKTLCGVVVTDLDGRRIFFGRATGRFFAKLLSGFTFGIGFIICAFTERKQCLHDMVADCLMFCKPR